MVSGKDREELQRQNIDIDIYEENHTSKIKKILLNLFFLKPQ